MASRGLTIVSLLVLAIPSLGQAGGGRDPRMGVAALRNFLRAAHVSGSLEYQGECGPHMWVPELPSIRDLTDYSGPPREVLRKMFAGDPRMRITEEPGGMIRMVETGVPTDLLDFEIHHLSFHGYSPESSHGPGVALLAILANPEVQAFRKANNIGPNPDSFSVPGDSFSGKPIVYGDLDDVTVSQALDYVLRTFPGFWLYESCLSKEGDRTVHLNFLETPPSAVLPSSR
jgi:hypothetical protein